MNRTKLHFLTTIMLTLVLFSLNLRVVAGETDLGGSLSGSPAVASWSSARMDVFVRGGNDHLWQRAWMGSAWSKWVDLGGSIQYDPAAVSWEENRIDIFAVGKNKSMWHLFWDGTAWSEWTDIGGQFQGSPTVTSWGPERLDIFAPGMNGHLWHQALDGKWSGWYDLGGAIKNGPAAVSWGPNRIDVFARGMDDHLWQIAWADNKWSNWTDLGGIITWSPGVASPGENKLNVFARGGDGNLWTLVWNGKQWEDWKSLGIPLRGTPAAIAINGRIEIFSRGTQMQVVQNTVPSAPVKIVVPGKKSTAPAGDLTPLHRFVQLKKDAFHFYTANEAQAAALKEQADWKYEGVIGYVYAKKAPGTVELYQLVKNEFGQVNHFYSTDMDEANRYIDQGGWNEEGVCCFVAPTQLAGTVPLYHLYKGCETPDDGKFRDECEDAIGGDAHFFTTDEKEKFSLTYQGYQDHGIQAYIWMSN